MIGVTSPFPDQTQKRPHFIQSVNRPMPSTLHQRTRTNSTPFSSQWVGRRPLSNSKPLNERPSTGRQLSGLALLRLTGALVIHAPELPPSGIGPFLNDDRARAMMFRLPRGKSFCHGKLAGGRGHLLPATCPTPLIMERWLSAGLCGRLRADAFAGATYFTHSAYLSLSNSRFAGHHTE